jgi:hypothetical protein
MHAFLRMNESDSEQGVNIINRKRQLIQFFTLALTLVSSMVLITSLSQAANGQLSASQQQALNSSYKNRLY